MFSQLQGVNVNQFNKFLFSVKSFSVPSYRGLSISNRMKISEYMMHKNNSVDTNSLHYKKTLSALSTVTHSIPQEKEKAFSKYERRKFVAAFPNILKDLIEYAKKYNDDSGKWYMKALLYNIPKGKKNRGLITIQAYIELTQKNQLTFENIKLARYLGWCMELVAGLAIVSDDIEDGSTTRRGQPCWHTRDDVGMIAINDVSTMTMGIFYIVKKYFGQKDYYTKMVHLFHDVIFRTALGQSLDLETSKLNVTSFTIDKYKCIATNKTASYTFYLPVALAMLFADIKDPEVFSQTERILHEIGYFFQVQDDFLDCYGNPKITGKIGTDIQNNKCTWLAVICMENATETQKKIMQECYGNKDPVKTALVKHLYKELGLPNAYAKYKGETYNMIKTLIEQTSMSISQNMLLTILRKIYNRVS